MPRRQSIVRVAAEEVQGEDAYVEMQRLTVGQRRFLSGEGMTEERSSPVLCEAVKGWNWVWEDGSPMPLPSRDPTVMERLTDMELAFLWRSLHQISSLSEDERKNSVSSS